MKRMTSLLAATVLGASLLTGCGGNDTDDYCKSLKQTKADFDDLEAGDFENFDELTDKFDDIEDKAPDEVKDDWKVLGDAVDGLVSALEDAGVTPKDLDALSKGGDLPEGVSQEDLLAAYQKASEDLGSDKFKKAAEAIGKHANDECDIDLDLS